MQRHLLGLIALGCLLGGYIAWAFQGSGQGDETARVSILVRVGWVLGAIWLAFPQLVKLFAKYPAWLIGTVLSVAAVLVINPRLIWLAIPLAIAFAIAQGIRWLFAPLPKQQRRTRKPQE